MFCPTFPFFVHSSSLHFQPRHRSSDSRYMIYKIKSEEEGVELLNSALSSLYQEPPYIIKGFEYREKDNIQKNPFFEHMVTRSYEEERLFSSKTHRTEKLEKVFLRDILLKDFKDDVYLAVELYNIDGHPSLQNLALTEYIYRKLCSPKIKKR